MVRASVAPRALSGRSRSGIPGDDQSDLAWRSSINRRMAAASILSGGKSRVMWPAWHGRGDLGAGVAAWYGAQACTARGLRPPPRAFAGAGLTTTGSEAGVMEGADQTEF